MRAPAARVLTAVFVALLLFAAARSPTWLTPTTLGMMASPVDVAPPARRAARGESVKVSLRLRNRPVELRPVPGLADTVSDEQLANVLCSALPWWNPPTVPSLIHELKLWGRSAEFTTAMTPRSRPRGWVAETLLSDRLVRERTTPDGASFLLDSPFGIRVVLSGSADSAGNRAEGHFGQLLSVLGESGLPLESPIASSSGRVGTIADLLRDQVLRFSYNDEIEFVSAALALWLPPESEWTDQFNNPHSFDELVGHLIETPKGAGPCAGVHVPYAVAVVLQADAQHPILSSTVRRSALDYLARIAGLLRRSERPAGGWDLSWAGAGSIKELWGDSLADDITVIGHHLEWIALAPPRVRPSRAIVARAVAALERQTSELPPIRQRLFKLILPSSHAARALCMLRDEDPWVAWRGFWERGELTKCSTGL